MTSYMQAGRLRNIMQTQVAINSPKKLIEVALPNIWTLLNYFRSILVTLPSSIFIQRMFACDSPLASLGVLGSFAGASISRLCWRKWL